MLTCTVFSCMFKMENCHSNAAAFDTLYMYNCGEASNRTHFIENVPC